MSPDRRFYKRHHEADPSSSEVTAWAAAKIPITGKESPHKGDGSAFYCEIEIGDQEFLGKLWASPFWINRGTVSIPFRDSQGGAMEVFATRNKTLVRDVISGEEHFKRLMDFRAMFGNKVGDSDGNIALSISSRACYDLVSFNMFYSAAGPPRYEPFKPVVMAFGIATRFERAFPGSKVRPISPKEIEEIRHTLEPQLAKA